MLLLTNESDLDVSGCVAIKFWANWCGPCKTMNPIVEKMESEFSSVKFLSVNVDKTPTIAQKFKIRMVPTLILVKNGREVNRVNGLVLTEALRKAFRDFTSEDV